jgi:hypothetical protein
VAVSLTLVALAVLAQMPTNRGRDIDPDPTAAATPNPRSLPPPRWNGNTLFITGTVTAAVSMTLHGLAAYGVQQNCRTARDPSDLLPSEVQELGVDDVLDSTFLARIDVLCSPEVALFGAARVLVPVFSAGAIAQIAAAGAFRGDTTGYREALGGRRRNVAVMLGVGSSLMLTGFALWAGSRASMPSNRIGCESIACTTWYDFGTYQASAFLFTAGTGLLMEGAYHRQRRRRTKRLRTMNLRPLLSTDTAGLMLDGHF